MEVFTMKRYLYLSLGLLVFGSALNIAAASFDPVDAARRYFSERQSPDGRKAILERATAAGYVLDGQGQNFVKPIIVEHFSEEEGSNESEQNKVEAAQQERGFLSRMGSYVSAPFTYGAGKLSDAFGSVYEWVQNNPKKAAGLLIGTGAVTGAGYLADQRYNQGRATKAIRSGLGTTGRVIATTGSQVGTAISGRVEPIVEYVLDKTGKLYEKITSYRQVESAPQYDAYDNIVLAGE
jgi:hypothetical protein